MKHLFFSIFLLLISFISFAQDRPAEKATGTEIKQESKEEALRQAGAAFRKHTRQYYLGAGIMMGGVVIITASGLTANDNPGLVTFGIITALTGTVLQVISHRHIGRAGEILENASLSSLRLQPASSGMGLGLAYHF